MLFRSTFFRWVFKTFVAVTLISNTFDITMAVFDLAQTVVAESSGIIAGNTAVDDTTLLILQTSLMTLELGELLALYLQSFLIGFTMKILGIAIFVIVYGRMVEIYRASRSAAFHSKAVCGHFGNPALASR